MREAVGQWPGARPPFDQDALSACEISAMGVEAMAGGVARIFPFVYVYYEEGAKNFGMMGREATPLRSMAAYAQAIRVLSGKQYLGDVQSLGAPVKLARVFGTDPAGECVAILYTGVVDSQATVAFPFSHPAPRRRRRPDAPTGGREGADSRRADLRLDKN